MYGLFQSSLSFADNYLLIYLFFDRRTDGRVQRNILLLKRDWTDWVPVFDFLSTCHFRLLLFLLLLLSLEGSVFLFFSG